MKNPRNLEGLQPAPEGAERRPLVLIQESVVIATAKFLRSSRSRWSRHEGVVYWAGQECGLQWLITTCIAPEAKTTRGSFHVTAGSNARVVALLAELKLQILAQVHSHPGTWIEHSGGDDIGAFMPYEDYLSVIVPEYCRRGLWPLTRCGVHRFQGGGFVRLSDSEIDNNFGILPVSCDLRKGK
jgi:hypothetical protein